MPDGVRDDMATHKTDLTKAPRIRLHAHFYVAGILLVLASFGFNYWLERVNRLKEANLSVPLKQSLSTVPGELGGWITVEGMNEKQKMKLSKEIEYISGINDYLNRIYVKKGSASAKATTVTDSSGKEIGLHVYAAYWGGIRNVAPHNPLVCMRGSGWTISGAYRREVELKMAGGTDKVSVNVNMFGRDYDKQMIVWWEYIHGKNVSSPLAERFRWILPLFLGGKAGSVVQVQISKDVETGESEDQVYETIVGFAKELAPEIGKCLPEAK